MTSVDLFHDPLCPAHAVCYGSYGSRNPCSAVVLRQLPCRKDRSGDQQHALATLVHFRSLALSPYVRHDFQQRKEVEFSEHDPPRQPNARRPFQLVTKVKNKGRNTSADPNSVQERNARRIGF
jgi:hypothetical protein